MPIGERWDVEALAEACAAGDDALRASGRNTSKANRHRRGAIPDVLKRGKPPLEAGL